MWEAATARPAQIARSRTPMNATTMISMTASVTPSVSTIIMSSNVTGTTQKSTKTASGRLESGKPRLPEEKMSKSPLLEEDRRDEFVPKSQFGLFISQFALSNRPLVQLLFLQ